MNNDLVLLGPGCGLNEAITAEQILESDIPEGFYLILWNLDVLGVACQGNPNEFILAFSTMDEAKAAMGVKDFFSYGKRKRKLEVEFISRRDIEIMCDITGRIVMIDPCLSLIEKSQFFNVGE